MARFTTEIIWVDKDDTYELRTKPRGGKIHITLGKESLPKSLTLDRLREFIEDLHDALKVMTEGQE